jgi:sterol desaturase/sphingolipid hydroxylase (fatty acid hydroxylase superfamily)
MPAMDTEPFIRVGVFAAVFIVLAAGERFFPKRPLADGRQRRWFTNFAMLSLDTILVRLCFPLAAVGVALYAQQNSIGLFNNTGLPYAVQWLAAIVILDLIIYWQHRLMHTVPLLWRLHNPHHADLDVDVSTGIRFHPLEILLSMLIKSLVILLFGMPAAAVLTFEIVLNATSLFTHSNLRLAPDLDRQLRRWIVTPDMHRTHHSIERAETDSNFSFNLSCWDRLFGTYTAAPRLDTRSMPLGLAEYRNPRQLGLLNILRLPFVKKLP